MKQIEGFLKEYWYLEREKRKLKLDLSLAQHAYENSTGSMPSSCRFSVVKSKNREIAKPVEISAMILIDEYRATVESIERELIRAGEKLKTIEDVIDKADLNYREKEYIKLRYFKNLSAEAVAQRLFCSESTCRRTRRTALEKIESVIEDSNN